MLAQRRGQGKNTRKKCGCEMCPRDKKRPKRRGGRTWTETVQSSWYSRYVAPDLPLATPPLAVCNYVFYFPMSPVARDAVEDSDGDNSRAAFLASTSMGAIFHNE
jgi:hypothetical protein